jgi:hypothetical protein
MNLPSDLIDLLAEFDAHGVDYLLVGGQALALHGHPRFTKDADVWLRDSPDNLDRAKAALRAFGAPPATVDGLDAARGLDVVWMGAPPARIDLMKAVPDGDFEAAWSRRETRDVAGTPVVVVGRADLAKLKRASGRPQDLLDAERLESDPTDS